MAISVTCDKDHKLYSYTSPYNLDTFWRSNYCGRQYRQEEILKLQKNNTNVVVRCTDNIRENSKDKFESYLYKAVPHICTKLKCCYEYYFMNEYGLSHEHLVNVYFLISEIPKLISIDLDFPKELVLYLIDYYLCICSNIWWRIKKMNDWYHRQLNPHKLIPEGWINYVIHCSTQNKCHNIYLSYNGKRCSECKFLYCQQVDKHFDDCYEYNAICNDCIDAYSDVDS